MIEAGEKAKIIALAQPLLHRDGLSESSLFEKYAHLTEAENVRQSQLFRLFALLAGEPTDTKSHLFGVVLRVPSCKVYFQLFEWLCATYEAPARGSDDKDGRAFDFLRSDDVSGFLESVRESRPDNVWLVAVFAGAFTSLSFKDWLAAAKDVLASGLLEKSDAVIMRVLCGDRDACRAFERTYFDRLWSDVWCGMIKIKAGGSATFKLSPPVREDWYAQAVYVAVSKGIRVVCTECAAPLAFSVTVACVLGDPSEDLLRRYIDTLVDKRMLGMVVVYASMAPSDAPVRLLAEVLALLPEPDEKPLEIARKFEIDPIDVTSAVVERLLSDRSEVFDGEMQAGELAERRMAALDWMESLPGCEEVQSDKVRRMLQRLVIDGEIEWGRKLFENPKFESAFSAPSFKRERECWEVFFSAETAYNEWKSGTGSSADAMEKLKAVLQYPGGWMRHCGETVKKDVGSYCIPLVARQLHEVLMASKQVDAALGIAALICDNGKMLEEYFSRDALKRFLIDICKSAAIARYSI